MCGGSPACLMEKPVEDAPQAVRCPKLPHFSALQYKLPGSYWVYCRQCSGRVSEVL